ncbi:MAG: tetratricopeptide repeat protein [Blastocatellia bacterium]
MRLKPARISFFGASVIVLFISGIIAQDIGHLGVSADPIPLVQAKRPPRRLVARRTPAPNPASSTLLADTGPAASGAGAAKNQNSGAPANTSSAIAANTTPAAVPKPEPVVTKPETKPAAPTVEDYIAKAEDLAAKNDPRGAAEAFRQALALKSDSFEARLGLADSLHDAKDYQNADNEYQKVIAQKSDAAEAHRGRGDTLYELKRYDEAITEYQWAIKAGAVDAGVYNNLANAYFRTSTRESRERAIENYRKAIEKQPDWSDAHAGLAYVLRVQQRVNEAQQAVEKAIQLAPNSALAHSVAGRVYADLKDFARANAEGQRAIDLAKQGSNANLNSFAYLNMGGILYAQGRFDEAIRAYTAAQSYDRTWAVPRNSLGAVYLVANRPSYAIVEFEEAAKLEPKSPIIHGNLGTAYVMLQKYDAAIANLQIAAQLDPQNPTPHVKMGQAYVRQGRFNEAVNAFRRATEIEPDNTQFKQALADSLKLAGRKNEAKEVSGGKEKKEKKKKN